MRNYEFLTFIVLVLFLISKVVSQQETQLINVASNLTQLNWGYNYDSTCVYLENLSQNPYVKIDSIGSSVEGRAIWMVTVSEPTQHFETVYRVAIHARTHPNEVQSQWLTQKMIEILISDSELARKLRSRVIFNIIPMYNPDGVELEYGRLNANGIDLERNWFVDEHEPEVAALKKKYYEFMNSSIPINIMLNMHGDGGANKAYFYYHHENGTSLKYTEDEKHFIDLIQQYFPDGISDWDRSITWIDGNPMLFPESWFWVNYEESVMAITFEEIPIPNRFDSLYTKTASALLNGIADYLDIKTTVKVDDNVFRAFTNLEQNYPNPFNPKTEISYSLTKSSNVELKIYNSLGQEVEILVNTKQEAGKFNILFNANNLPSGIYFYSLRTDNYFSIKKMILIK